MTSVIFTKFSCDVILFLFLLFISHTNFEDEHKQNGCSEKNICNFFRKSLVVESFLSKVAGYIAPTLLKKYLIIGV